MLQLTDHNGQKSRNGMSVPCIFRFPRQFITLAKLEAVVPADTDQDRHTVNSERAVIRM